MRISTAVPGSSKFLRRTTSAGEAFAKPLCARDGTRHRNSPIRFASPGWGSRHAVAQSKSPAKSLVAAVENDDSLRQQSLMMDLARESGVWSKVTLDNGVNGRGLYVCGEEIGRPPSVEAGPDGEVYLSIPAVMTLSPTLPSACQEATQDPRLQPLLDSDEPWEIKLGGMLAVACRARNAGGIAGDSGTWSIFWRSYRSLMPTSEEQTSLLFLSDEELAELEDPELTATGRRWRSQVEDAHTKYFQCLDEEGGDAKPAVELEDLRWGVGLSESRAFSVKLNGAEHAAAVPFLDMANHEPHALGYHRFDESAERFEMRAIGPSIPAGSEALITYGNKANKRLMEQYGFCIPGNPFDRVPFPQPEELGAARIGRDKVIAALGLDRDHGGRSPAMQIVHDAAARAAADMFMSEALALEDFPSDGELWTSAWGAEEQRRIGAVAASLLETVCWRSLSELRAVQAEKNAGEETKILAQLQEWVNCQLEKSSTTLEEDLERLDIARSQSGNSRLAAALAYRVERKRLMRTCDKVLRILQDATE